MITQDDAVDAKLRRGITHRHNPAFCRAYDDRRRPPNPHLMQAVRRYDRNLFLRYNVAAGMWELWRWFGLIVPRCASLVPPEELTRRAGFIFKLCHPETGEPLPPDMRVYRRLVIADRWAKGQYTGDQAADAMDSDTRIMDRRKAAARREFADDWAKDNKNQIRSFVGKQTLISIPK